MCIHIAFSCNRRWHVWSTGTAGARTSERTSTFEHSSCTYAHPTRSTAPCYRLPAGCARKVPSPTLPRPRPPSSPSAHARESQQPAFYVSTGLTKESTVPLTPPWEFSLHLLVTTPSPLPEVPFTCFLWPSVAADQQLPHYSCSSTTTRA